MQEQLEFHTEGTPQLFPHSCFPQWARVSLRVLSIFEKDCLPRNHLQGEVRGTFREPEDCKWGFYVLVSGCLDAFLFQPGHYENS